MWIYRNRYRQKGRECLCKQGMNFPTVPIKMVDNYIESGMEMMLIDLRDTASYECCHLFGAINLPFQELEEHLDILSKEKTLVFYCYRGGQSMLVCRDLCGLGYQVVNIMGGIQHYCGKYLIRG